MSIESKPAEPQSVSLKPVLIAMIVAASLPLVVCSGGFLEVLLAPLTGETMITIALGLTALQNGWVLFACITTLRGRRTYLFPLTASVAVFVAWFWTAFTPLSVGFQILGTLISIPIGLWSFTVLRTPEVRSEFDGQSDPVEPIGRMIIARLPKLKLDPTPQNINRVSVIGLSGLAVLGLLLGRVFAPADEDAKTRKEYDAKNKADLEHYVQMFKDGNQRWDSGKKDDAVELYLKVLSGDAPGSFRIQYHKEFSTLYHRAINYRVEKAGAESVRGLIREALRDRVVLSLDSKEANAIVAQETTKYDKEQDQQLREFNAKEKEDRDQEAADKGGVAASGGRTGSVSVKGDDAEGKATFNADGSYSGSYRGKGFSGKSKMNADGSGVGEYEVDGKKMRVKVDGKGGASVETE